MCRIWTFLTSAQRARQFSPGLSQFFLQTKMYAISCCNQKSATHNRFKLNCFWPSFTYLLSCGDRNWSVGVTIYNHFILPIKWTLSSVLTLTLRPLAHCSYNHVHFHHFEIVHKKVEMPEMEKKRKESIRKVFTLGWGVKVDALRMRSCNKGSKYTSTWK